MLIDSGLLFENICTQAIRAMVVIGAYPSCALWPVFKLPDAVMVRLHPVCSRHVHLLRASSIIRT